ncbi:unnamed protein product [Adineta steineri]|uniref:CLLAC-motif containing domain-containing protein n=1 Tax=Adineta steineri TaxID=433720 RepID=A0A819KR02_9BILA|nr:unnamed protein product [Adineta steineri]
MASRQHFDSLLNPASPNHASHSSRKQIVWADDDDNNQTDKKKTSFGWCWCLKCCIIGSLLAGIGLAVVLTFYLTSKTTATETLISTTSTTSATTSTSTTSTSTSTTSTSTSTTSTSTSTTSTSTSTTAIPGTGRIVLSNRQ